jgi:Nif-specific regulatory protein
MEDEAERIRRERDLYLRLLDLGTSNEVEQFLFEALASIVALTGAAQGYLEVRNQLERDDENAWWMAHGCSGNDVERIRSSISRGIIAEALATGKTISTHSALLDGRFRDLASVQRERIEAVLCSPLVGQATCGVVYLQGRESPGPFSESDREAAERFAHHLSSLADALLARRQAADSRDATRSLRERHRLDGIVGRAPALAAALEQAMLAAPLDVNVLLTGESGTGKSQLAHAIHLNSPRAAGPFVELNCAAIPDSLLESELFGAVAGAHSEARRNREGKVAAAAHGTLFLDEVAELPPESQAKLLQLLQSRLYYPLGASDPVHADIRLVAATNADLEEAVREKRLREDLYYRLQVLPIRMPTLDERRSDLAELSSALCERACERHRLPRLVLSPGALAAIEGAEWPGNIRQLANAVEAGAVRAAGQGASRVETRHVFPEAQQAAAMNDPTFQEATRRFQRDLLERTLRDLDWNVTEAARRLDLARSHVYNLVKAFGLSRDEKG